MKYMKYLVILLLLVTMTIQFTNSQGTAPAIRGVQTVSYSDATVEHTLNWTVTDDNLASYDIELNGSVVASGTWAERDETNAVSEVVRITFVLDDGEHVFKLVVTDYDGLSASYTTTVSITSPEAPSGPIPVSPIPLLVGFSVMITAVRWKRIR